MKKLLPILTFAKIDIKRLFRDKVGIFFVFAFPLIFLLVFGGLFGRDSDVSFNVALLNESDSEFSNQLEGQLNDSDIFNIDQETAGEEEARERMSRGSIDAIITMPEGFGEVGEAGYPTGQAKVLYSQGSDQAGMALGSILESIFAEVNADLVPIDPPFTVLTEATAIEGLTNLDYLFSGLLGFTLLSLGIFGPTTVFPRMKEKGILRRYHTTPIKVWQYFAGNVLSNSAIGLIAVAIMFIAAVLLFGISMQGDYLSFATLVVMGTIMLFGVGLAAGGWAKNENQAAPLANLVAFPMMFLSGVFFPRFLMPEWLQVVSEYLPLTPVIDSLRMVINEGKTLLEVGPEVGLIAIWIVVVYSIAFKVFRWE